MGARQKAELAELADWVEGLRAAAHTARVQGNTALAEALDITRFEVYQDYLDEELDHKQSQAAARRACRVDAKCSPDPLDGDPVSKRHAYAISAGGSLRAEKLLDDR